MKIMKTATVTKYTKIRNYINMDILFLPFYKKCSLILLYMIILLFNYIKNKLIVVIYKKRRLLWNKFGEE